MPETRKLARQLQRGRPSSLSDYCSTLENFFFLRGERKAAGVKEWGSEFNLPRLTYYLLSHGKDIAQGAQRGITGLGRGGGGGCNFE